MDTKYPITPFRSTQLSEKYPSSERLSKKGTGGLAYFQVCDFAEMPENDIQSF
jgi:hypothetical protein